MPNTDISIEPLLNARTNAVGGYQISDQEVGTTSYYGYINEFNAWYIMKSVITGAETNYTYTKGDSGYATAWTGRAALSYDRFNAIF